MPCGVRSYMNQVTPTFLKLNHKLMILEIVYLSKLTSKHRDKAKERKRKRQEKTKENQGHSPKKIWESGLDIVSCFYLDAWTYTDFVLQETSGRYNVFRQAIPGLIKSDGKKEWRLTFWWNLVTLKCLKLKLPAGSPLVERASCCAGKKPQAWPPWVSL